MELTLRKASAIQTAILEKINGIVLTTAVDLNEFQDPKEVLTRAETDLLTSLNQKITLWNIFYEIRADLGKANTISGVSRYLCELAKLEKLIQLYKTVTATSSLQEAGDVIVGKLEKIKKGSSSERSYGYSDTVKSGVIVNNSILLDTLTTFEKQKQSINDKLLELNITTKISLSPNTQEVLTKYNLL